jgi:hypothetical protein
MGKGIGEVLLSSFFEGAVFRTSLKNYRGRRRDRRSVGAPQSSKFTSLGIGEGIR